MNPQNPNNLTQEQIKAGYSTIPGAFDPLTGKLKTTNVITPDALQPEPKITLPTTPTPTQTTPFMNNADTILKAMEVQQTEAQKTQETGISEILKSMQGLTGEAETLAQEQEKAGVNTLRRELQGINSQILKKQAELQQDDIQLIANMRAEERRDTLLPFAQMGQAKLAGDAQIARALKNAEIGVLNATAIAKQGDIGLAQQIAEEAVAVKYAPYKENIKRWEDTLKVIEPLLTRDEKKQAQAQKVRGDLAMREIEKAEEEEKSIKELALRVGSFGADASTIQRVMNAKDMNEAITAAGRFLQNPKDSLDMQLTKAQIAKAWSDAKKVDTTSGTLSEAQLKQIDMSPQGKKLVSLSGLYQKSQTYKNLLDTYGFQAVGPEKAKLDQAYADLKIAYKEAANLGALTGPDVLLLEEAIKPASGAVNYLNYRISGGKKGVSGAIEGALQKSKAEALQNYKQLTSRKPEYRGSEYVNSLIAPFAEDYSKVELENLPVGEIIQTPDGILLEALGNGQFSPL